MFLLFISILNSISGQVEKPVTSGHFLVGGSISYYSQSSKQKGFVWPSQYVPLITKENVFQPDMLFGYYFFDHLAFILHADASTHTIKQTNFNTIRYSAFGIGPLIRYSTNSGLFIQGSTSFVFKKSETNSQSYSLGVGYSFFIKGLFSIEPSLSYKYTRTPSRGGQGEIKTRGMFLALGTYIYFDRQKWKQTNSNSILSN